MKKKIGCLLIHGFGGNIQEVIPLAQSLQAQGYDVLCPALKGHNGKRQDFIGVKHQDWISSAEEELQQLMARNEGVFVIGFSMGGLIALNLGVRYQLRGIVTLNSPIYYWDLKRIALNLMEDIKIRRLVNTKRYLQSSIKFPLSALVHFRILLGKTKKLLNQVQCPVFVAQALEDDTVRKNSAHYLYTHIASSNKALKFYPKSGHLILWSEAASQVIEDVKGFIHDELTDAEQPDPKELRDYWNE
ncbi:MAG: alpha/beta fold hydrolase [Peptococcaceae bacterium]|nr:alpha/beta fold hydrolase [Peptococcaceae bacterium]